MTSTRRETAMVNELEHVQSLLFLSVKEKDFLGFPHFCA